MIEKIQRKLKKSEMTAIKFDGTSESVDAIIDEFCLNVSVQRYYPSEELKGLYFVNEFGEFLAEKGTYVYKDSFGRVGVINPDQLDIYFEECE